MDTRERTIVKEQPVRGGYDRKDYDTERVWAKSQDGVEVPISLVYRRDLHRKDSPLLLYGYGAYEQSGDPTFDSNRLSLLGSGLILATAQLPGGGPQGRA